MAHSGLSTLAAWHSSGVNLPLSGFVVGVTAERRRHQQVQFLQRRGATVREAAVLTTVDRSERPEVLAATQSIIDTPPDILVVQTGQGLRWWLSAIGEADADRLLRSLQQTEIWCRGIKATSACRKVGLSVAWQSSEETTADVANHLSTTDLAGKHVVIQIDGNDPASLTEAAAQAKTLTELDLYRYTLPDDLVPALDLVDGVIDGSIHAVTFTSSPAIRHLRQIGANAGRVKELDAAFGSADRSGTVAAVVGPVCAAAANEAGWRNVIEPSTARLVPMLDALTQELVGRGVPERPACT